MGVCSILPPSTNVKILHDLLSVNTARGDPRPPDSFEDFFSTFKKVAFAKCATLLASSIAITFIAHGKKGVKNL
jgi:hypothetical protein